MQNNPINRETKKKTTKHTRHLVLVRHGESVWNVEGKWTGWTDVGLTEKGKEEARQVAAAISHIEFHIAFTSDLTRAHETLEIIKATLGRRALPVRREEALKERHYGIYTGKVKWEIQKEIGEEAFKNLRRGWDVPIPEGETLKDVHERVVPHFLKHVQPHLKRGKNVLLVAHGNTIRTLIKHLENIPNEDISEVEVGTGEVIIYTLDHTGKVIGKETIN